MTATSQDGDWADVLVVEQKYLVLLILKEFLELYDVTLGETGRRQTLEELVVL